jgi:hypothetical protein
MDDIFIETGLYGSVTDLIPSIDGSGTDLIAGIWF